MFVLRSHEGDKYYLIATDLKVSSMGWSQNQVNGSRKVEVYALSLIHISSPGCAVITLACLLLRAGLYCLWWESRYVDK